MKYLLAIESSCDETAAAVIDDQIQVHSNVVASQTDLHERFGGVVPEIASRAHVERILPVIDEAITTAKISLRDLSAIAVATEPGLVGSLLVGLTAAKSLAAVLNIPLVTINHIEAHIYACQFAAQHSIFPTIGFVVSGGHTNLYDCENALQFNLLGATIDDAAGEAFDKVAKILGLTYPGGPAISQLAEQGDPTAFSFPRTFLKDDRLDFSFSGLKTALLYQAMGTPGSHKVVPPLTEQRRADLAASFQMAVVDVLVGKCQQALERKKRNRICVGGGVAANRMLRNRLQKMAQKTGTELILSPIEYCTDNAAMGGIAWEMLKKGKVASLDSDVTPGLVRMPQRRGRKAKVT